MRDAPVTYRTPPRAAVRIVWALLTICSISGCAGGPAEIHLTGFRDPYFPDQHRVQFENWTYRADAGGDYHITARADGVQLDKSQPAATHLLHLHLVWTPKPGHTPTSPSGIDATIRYCILAPSGHALYVGTGFVFIEKRSFGDGIAVSLERSELRLVEETGESAHELSPLRLLGKLTARRAPTATLTVQREIDRAAVQIADTR